MSLTEKLKGVPVKKIGGGQGYCGNYNKNFAKIRYRNFIHKCRTDKNEGENAIKRKLARLRATMMESSFGTQRDHYGLRRIAARIKPSDIMLILFGIYAANVVNFARRESIQIALAA